MDQESKKIKDLENQISKLEEQVKLCRQELAACQETKERQEIKLEQNEEELKQDEELIGIGGFAILLLHNAAKASIKYVDQILQALKNCDDAADVLSSIHDLLDSHQNTWKAMQLSEIHEMGLNMIRVANLKDSDDEEETSDLDSEQTDAED